jgi:hypothetical protein
MTLDVLAWVVVADAVAAVLFGLIVYLVGKRSRQPVSGGKAIGIAGCLTLPAALLYGIVWLWHRG